MFDKECRDCIYRLRIYPLGTLLFELTIAQ